MQNPRLGNRKPVDRRHALQQRRVRMVIGAVPGVGRGICQIPAAQPNQRGFERFGQLQQVDRERVRRELVPP